MKTIAILFLLLMTATSCAPTEDGKASIRSTQPNDKEDEDGANFKPGGDTPPLANPEKLTVGTEFVWRYIDNSGCFKWTVIENGNDKMAIVETKSANCKNFPETSFRELSWYISNGSVIDDIYCNNKKCRELEGFDNILPRMAMGVSKSKYKINVMKFNEVSYPVFSLDSNPNIIYARTEDALVGVVLKSTSKDSKPFTFLRVSPAK